MGLVANYYYCDGSTRLTKSVTLTVGAETQYFAGNIGDCYVIKKRRKITASFTGSIAVALRIRFSYVWTDGDFYDVLGENDITYLVNDYIEIVAGQVSNFKYLDTYVKADCLEAGYEGGIPAAI